VACAAACCAQARCNTWQIDDGSDCWVGYHTVGNCDQPKPGMKFIGGQRGAAGAFKNATMRVRVQQVKSARSFDATLLSCFLACELGRLGQRPMWHQQMRAVLSILLSRVLQDRPAQPPPMDCLLDQAHRTAVCFASCYLQPHARLGCLLSHACTPGSCRYSFISCTTILSRQALDGPDNATAKVLATHALFAPDYSDPSGFKLVLTVDVPSAGTGTGGRLLLDGRDTAMVRASVVDSSNNNALVAAATNRITWRVVSGE
jgi:hypothetical protein